MPAIKLKEISTRAPESISKEKTKGETDAMLSELDDLQNLLYAENRHSLLVVLQGMDASGKDGAIREVFGKLNPQGVMVKSYKVPTEEELSHDFLWRIHSHAPPKGMIQIFNRSHYEDILVTRVHKWCDNATAHNRMDAINDFEKLLALHNNTQILKFYLHVSPEEQMERLKERTSNPKKMWKYNEKDIEEAKYWDEYMNMYEECFSKCDYIPWHIIPSDQNWYKEYLITKKVYETLKGLNMKYPKLKSDR
ncbi:MAG: deoxynucleoside kinase [Sphingobacteriales bacterium]|jgi:PPK2 family polyphosphate:nucleotide phosphotransferase|nr:deoxynucleoside kinase [Sphingobacteriales bacterium]OJY85767.1 MAG: polyphosphate kinase [Sphingobacteriales bacterium 44-15]